MNLKPYLHVILMALVVFGAMSAYGVWYGKVGEESAAVVSLQSEIQAKAQTIAHAQSAKSQLAQALADRASVTNYFVNTNDVVPFLETLQATGAKYGAKVAVESVSAQPAQPHTLLQLALRITGSFDAVERTLGAIEFEPYDTAVSSVTFDTPPVAAPAAAAQWTAAVTVNVGTIDTAGTTTAPKTP